MLLLLQEEIRQGRISFIVDDYYCYSLTHNTLPPPHLSYCIGHGFVVVPIQLKLTDPFVHFK